MKRHLPHHKPDDLTAQLRGQSRKMTGPRRAILEQLERQEHPLSIRRLHELLRSAKCDLATVYRSIKMLEGLGLVSRYDFGDGVARYELNRHQDDKHHHHLICTGCAKVVEIEECFPSELEQRVAAGNGFTRITHKLEFFGICPKCQ